MSSRTRFIDRDDKDITEKIEAHRLVTEGGAAGLVVKYYGQWWSVNALCPGGDLYQIIDWRYTIPEEQM